MMGVMGGPACGSCGSPMMSVAERGGRKADNPYCRLCCNEKGVLLPYREVLKNLVEERYVKVNGMDRAKAESTAHDLLAHMPAWKGGAR